MRILVTGGTGQIGIELARQMWPEGATLHFPDRLALNLADPDSITAQFASEHWDCVVNSAAWTAVDAAEDHVADAFLANTLGPAWLAEAAARRNVPIIQISTDYVFDGSLERPYNEQDSVAPIGVYGASKLAGEFAVLAANPRAIILRTAWVLSAHRSNFLKTMLRLGAERERLSIVADQYGCPTSAADIAAAVRTIAQRMAGDADPPCGIYHFVNQGSASWCELARTIFECAHARGRPMASVEAISSAQFPTRARRPTNSRLDTTKIARDFGIESRPWRDAVAEIIAELIPGEND